METWIIVGGIIFLFFILILGGILIWWFFFRKSNNNGGGSGDGNGPGINTPASGGIPGNFTIQPTPNTNLYLTFDQTPGNELPNAVLVPSTAAPNIPCDNLLWRNTIIPSVPNNPQQATNSALQNNAQSITVQGQSQDQPFYLVAPTGDSAFVTNNILSGELATLIYNSTNQTFCGSGSDANQCLYYDVTNALVTRKVFDSSDQHFKWTISSVPSNCIAS